MGGESRSPGADLHTSAASKRIAIDRGWIDTRREVAPIAGMLSFRPARPEDGSDLAELIDMAGERMLSEMLGKSWRQRLGRLCAEPGHALSFDRALVATEGPVIIGAIVAGPGSEKRPAEQRLERLLWRQVWWRMPAILLWYTALRPILRFMHEVPDDAFYVEAIAVHQPHRGRGLGKKMLDLARGQARAANLSALALDVATNNFMAIKVYQRYGFQVVATSPSVESEGRRSAVHRMSMRL